ncbi:hypothetical protein F5878DRAFT_610893 [Lentinula raphanica]|uniref:Uncharacterized protein n=1 Tax=Lentinula raphanica TaxID=153919 RepID=A0AA38UHC6_9AGAR|nr:hypothetical protein F5878DRAFT_610893 [Lentinula raphanica]
MNVLLNLHCTPHLFIFSFLVCNIQIHRVIHNAIAMINVVCHISTMVTISWLLVSWSSWMGDKMSSCNGSTSSSQEASGFRSQAMHRLQWETLARKYTYLRNSGKL